MTAAPLALVLLLAAEGTPAATTIPQLQPLAFLAGSCWTATFPDGKQTDTHCFETVFGGRFIRDRHVVKNGKAPYEGETLYAWDANTKKLVYTYWASDGGLSSGRVEPAASGELTFHEAYVGDAGAMRLKTTWTPKPDGYEASTMSRKDGDGAWKEMWKMSFRRDAPTATSEGSSR